MSILRWSLVIAVGCTAGATYASARPIVRNTTSEPVVQSEPAPAADGSCPGGYYPCGDSYCTPNDGVCCADVGHPEGYCPSGYTCTADGGCTQGGGGGTCDDGYYSCGDSYCTPDDGVCCADVGHPEGYCPSGSTCTADGGCSSDGGGGGGGSYTCSDVSDIGDCTVQYCVDIDTCGGYYVVDGVEFDCASCSDIQACAREAADYCAGDGGGADDDEAGGCRVASGGDGMPVALALGALFGLTAVRRRRRR